jgi:putative ABC transport system permease protein
MLKHYFFTALRNFWQFRLTTAVNVVGLALGLVCFIATYLFLDSLLKSDLHYANARRIYVITQDLWIGRAARIIPALPTSAAGTARYLKADFPALETVARALSLGPLAVAADDHKLTPFIAGVDPEFLQIFALPFIRGNPHQALEAAHSIVVSASMAQRLFGTADVVGRHLTLQNNVDVTVTGVFSALRQPSHLGDTERAMLQFDGLVPMALVKSLEKVTMFGTPADPDMDLWGADTYFTYAMLPADGSLTPAEFIAGLKSFGEKHIPKHDVIANFGAVPVSRIALSSMEGLFGGGRASITRGVFLLDALVLVIACLNYANLALAIASTRAREIGMRKVMGAGSLHLIGQYALEALMLSALALLLVLIGVALAITPLNHAMGMSLRLQSLLDPSLWLLVVLLLIGVCIIGGAFPAVALSRVRPMHALRAGAIIAGPRFVPTLLVGVQFAAASFLLVITLLTLDQNRFLQRQAAGLDRDPYVAITNDTQALRIDLDTLRKELLSSASIKSVTAALTPPWQSGGVHIPLLRIDAPASTPITTIMDPVSHDFFSTVGIGLLAGRSFDRQHDDESNIGEVYHGPRTANVIVDRALARELGWPNPDDAVGKVIAALSWSDSASLHELRIIGVVENGYPRLIGPNAGSNLYVLSATEALAPIIRIERRDIKGAIAQIEAVWERLARGAPLKLQFADELFSEQYRNFLDISRILAGVAGFALVISSMGLFGMAIHVTSRRRREIGIRKTLGASAPRLVFMLLRDFAKPVIIANLLVWPLAFLAGQIYLNLFVARVPLTPWPFLAALVLTVVIAWLTVSGQALRAAVVKPGRVLHLDQS